MITSGVAGDACAINVASVAVIRTVQTSARDYFCVGPGKATRIADMVTPQEISHWTSSTKSSRRTGTAVGGTSLAKISHEIKIEQQRLA